MKLLRFLVTRKLKIQALFMFDKSLLSRYQSDLGIRKMVSYLMFDGLRLRAMSLFLNTLYYLKSLTGLSPLHIFKRAIANCFLLFDIKRIIRTRKTKRKIIKKKPKFMFGLIHPNIKISRSVRFMYNLALTLKKNSKFKGKYAFHEILAFSILFTFLRRGLIFYKIRALYKYLLRKRTKLKELTLMRKTARKFFVKVGRYKKEKGFYNFNPYTLSPWVKPLK